MTPPPAPPSTSNLNSNDPQAGIRKFSQTENIKALAQKFETGETSVEKDVVEERAKGRRTSLPVSALAASRAPSSSRVQTGRRVTGPYQASNSAEQVDSKTRRSGDADGNGEQLVMSPLSEMDWTPRSVAGGETSKVQRNGSRIVSSANPEGSQEGLARRIGQDSRTTPVRVQSSTPTSTSSPHASSTSSSNVPRATIISSREERRNQTQMASKVPPSNLFEGKGKQDQRPTLQLLTTPIQPAAKPLLVQKNAKGQNSPSSPAEAAVTSNDSDKVKKVERSREKITSPANVVPPSVRVVNATPSPALGNLPLEVSIPSSNSRAGNGRPGRGKEAGPVKPPSTSDSGKKNSRADRDGKVEIEKPKSSLHQNSRGSNPSKSTPHSHRPSSSSSPVQVPSPSTEERSDPSKSKIDEKKDSKNENNHRSRHLPSRIIPPSKPVEEAHHPLSPNPPSEPENPFGDEGDENGTKRSNQSGRRPNDPFRDPGKGQVESGNHDSKEPESEDEGEKEPFFSNPVNGPASSLPSFNNDSPAPSHLNNGSRISNQSPFDSKPVAAASVFKPSAAPLCLPALERYLSDPFKFPEPYFSDPTILCTDEERALFGYDEKDSSDGPRNLQSRKKKSGNWFGIGNKVEIAGGQFEAPRSAMNFNPKFNRKKPKDERNAKEEIEEDEEDEEEKGLLSQDEEEEEKKQIASQTLEEDRKVSLNISDKENTSSSTGFETPARPSAVTQESGLSIPTIGDTTISAGIPSSLSTASNPLSRKECFPPLMLLKETSLVELKSNAVGPRAPPGGVLGKIPPLGSILGTVIDWIIGAEGSSFAAGIIKLELFRDAAQMLAMNLSFDSQSSASSSSTRNFFVHTLPSILALDFVSVFGKAIIFLCAWFIVTILGLWRFHRMSSSYNPNRNIEGFENQPWIFTSPSQGTKLANIVTVFILTSLYIPLSKLAIDTLAWNSSFWVVADPYANGIDNPELPPLGPSSQFRDPLDFCWTTTMRKDDFNFAWLVIPLSAFVLIVYTLYFPIKMVKIIKDLLPHVSEYNELGRKRSSEEMELEYQRLLSKDKSPLNFLYNSYTRRVGFYKPLYMLFFKLSNVVVITLLTKENCLWRGLNNKTILTVQQASLIFLMGVLLLIHILVTPFVDRVSNRSELVSRCGYLFTAIIGLLVALQVQGSTVYNTTILYIVMGFTYIGNGYFSISNTSIFAHTVKRVQNRVDFSIDIFSPTLSLDRHIKRRIWEETLSTILLCGPSYHMPQDQVVAFSLSDSDRWPPYLLYFAGSAAERHVENIKIVKEIGIEEYRANIEYSRSHISQRLKRAIHEIQTKFAGPDAYWRPLRPPYQSGVSSWFGKAFLVPFPPTLVMRYDQGGSRTVQLTTLEELEAFVQQNESEEVKSRRMVRNALRALDGQRIFCPHVEQIQVGANQDNWGGTPRSRRARTKYSLAIPVSYVEGVLTIKRKNDFEWEGYNFASGFEVLVTYSEGRREDPEGNVRVTKSLTVPASAAFGLHDDFEMSSSLLQMMNNNEWLIRERIPTIHTLMAEYRTAFYKEARRKMRTMSYSFLVDIFDNSRLSPEDLNQAFIKSSCSKSIRELPKRYEASITLMFERLKVVNRSDIHKWWWLFWDDFWRKNSKDYKLLRNHRRHFSPSYPTSIAYRPMSRTTLEIFLKKKGFWIKGGSKGFINRGLLNRIYFYLDEIVFAKHHQGSRTLLNSSHLLKNPITSNPNPNAVTLALGKDVLHTEPHSYNTIENNLGLNSRLTGGGTEETTSIVERSYYPWEQRMNGRPIATRTQRVKGRLLELLNISPYSATANQEKQLFLYVRLENGSYVLPNHPVESHSMH